MKIDLKRVSMLCIVLSVMSCEEAEQAGANGDVGAAETGKDVQSSSDVAQAGTADTQSGGLEEDPILPCEERLTEEACAADSGSASGMDESDDSCLWLPTAHFSAAGVCDEELNVSYSCVEVKATGDGGCKSCAEPRGGQELSFFSRLNGDGTVDVLGRFGCGFYQPLGWEAGCEGAHCDCFCSDLPNPE